MPKKPPTVCRAYGCSNATTNRDGYCDSCESPILKKRRHKKSDPFYGTARWKKFRAWYIGKHPLCEECLDVDRMVDANVVDHIVEIKDGGSLTSEDNARSLCNKCHAKKTSLSKMKREGLVESPPSPPALPFGSLSSS